MRALVLAAGEGRRMGGPKALLDWHGAPLAVAHARALVASGVDHVWLVVRASVADALAMDGRLSHPVTVVASHKPDAWGPAGSLRAAVESTEVGEGLWVVTPVDALPVRRDTLAVLRAAMGDGGSVDAARPVYQGRGGHPVVLRGAVLKGFHGTDAPPTLRDVLGALGPRAVRVSVDDPGITADLDTPTDRDRWLRDRDGTVS